MGEFMTVREVACRLGVHEKTIYRWIEQGRFETVRLGTRAIRITEGQIAKFLKAKKS